MEELELSALIALIGVIISALLSFIISKYQNKIELIKTHSGFIGQLYSKRLDAYLRIYEVISDYIKVIKRKGILYEELLVFYESYSKLDSESGLLFSYTAFHSDQLIKKIEEILESIKKGVLSDSQKADLLDKLQYVETTMKLEVGVYLYKDPATIVKKYDIPKRKRKMLGYIMNNYSKNNLYDGENVT